MIIMNYDPTDSQHSQNKLLKRSRYRYAETVLSGNNGESLLLPPGEGDATITVVPTTSAKIQFTQSSMQDVEDDIAVWIDWSEGDVTTTTVKVMSNSVTAIRLVAVSGDASYTVTV